jgi:hypothetical protein
MHPVTRRLGETVAEQHFLPTATLRTADGLCGSLGTGPQPLQCPFSGSYQTTTRIHFGIRITQDRAELARQTQLIASLGFPLPTPGTNIEPAGRHRRSLRCPPKASGPGTEAEGLTAGPQEKGQIHPCLPRRQDWRSRSLGGLDPKPVRLSDATTHGSCGSCSRTRLGCPPSEHSARFTIENPSYDLKH